MQIRKEVRRTKHERHTDARSHPRGRMADFNLVTQQNMELGMTFQLSLKIDDESRLVIPDAASFLSAYKRVVDPMERVTTVLLFAGCAPNRRCLDYQYEFVYYCSTVSATSH